MSLLVDDVKVYFYFLPFGHQWSVGDPLCHVQHLLAGHSAALIAVLVRVKDDCLDPALDDHLGTLVAGEQPHIDVAARNALRVLVEDGIHLSVTHVQVLVLQSDKLPPVKSIDKTNTNSTLPDYFFPKAFHHPGTLSASHCNRLLQLCSSPGSQYTLPPDQILIA